MPSEYRNDHQFPSGIAELIDESDLEKSLKQVMAPKPTPTKKFKNFRNLTDAFKNGIVMSNFKEAYGYGGQAHDLLVYMTLINNIFQLEYTMCKLNSSGQDILKLETHVLSGQVFWRDEATLHEPEYGYVEDSENEGKFLYW